MKKNILLIMTGGTISMKNVADLGVVPTSELADFLTKFPQLKGVANVEVMDHLNIPSPYMTPEMMFGLAKLIDEKIVDYDGVVITHGTDTLEESAYMADLVLTTRKPVVFTAAMRSGSDLGLDGPRNIIGSVRVASHHESHDKGVLVVMNDEIHTARDVVKTDSGKVDAFNSPGLGPLGIVDPDTVVYHRNCPYRESVLTDSIDDNIDLIRAYCGMDGKFIKTSMQSGARAIVIEAFGRGNLPQEIVPIIKEAIEKGILIVIASRTYTGRVLPEYGYTGGGKNLEDLGAILAGDLKGSKARLRLMALFGAHKDPALVRQYFRSSHESEQED